jgi:hypothetical protein
MKDKRLNNMEKETTINYGQKRENMISTSHIRDVEIAVINYLLSSVENCLEILPKLSHEHFTYASTRRVYDLLKDVKINERVLDIVKNKYKELLLENDLEKYYDLTLYNAMYIFSSNPSTNIELDLFELNEYANEKLEILKQENNFNLKIEIEELTNTAIASFIDNRLFDIYTTNFYTINPDITDTFEKTLNNVIKYFNKDNYKVELMFDEITELPNKIILKKETEKLDKKYEISMWLAQNNFFNELIYNNLDFLISSPLLEFDNLGLKNLPKEIDVFEKTMILTLKNNELSTLPNEIKNLEKLLALILCNNKIEIISEFLYEMKTLNQLCLHGNGISEIKEDIVNLENLIQLSISKNKLQELPNNLSKLINLKELEFEDNPLLNNIPADIFKLPNLEKLSFDDRFLSIIVQNKHLFSKINSINLKYSNLDKNDELIKSLNFSITEDDWQEENDEKYYGAIHLCLNEVNH